MNAALNLMIGVQPDHPQIVRHVLDRGITPLITANSLWRPKTRTWRIPADLVGNCVLDSGGFTALRCYRGYRFTPQEYFELVRQLRPQWYAAMDFCCEEELGFDPWSCVRKTVANWLGMEAEARQLGLPAPVPVLQGLTWKQYQYCFALMWENLHPRFWPSTIAIGSVCRRETNQVLALVRNLETLPLPAHTRFHLFGVKGDALAHLDGTRVESTDSHAWSYSARVEARNRQVPADQALRIAHLDRWHDAQNNQPRQLALL